MFVTEQLQVTNAFPIKDLQRVIDYTVFLINDTIRERDAFTECVQDELVQCNATLYARIRAENARAERARADHRQRRDESQTTQAECTASRSQAYRAVSEWQSEQDAAAVSAGAQYSRGCSSEDQERLSVLTGDTSAQRSASMQLVHGYSAESQSTVAALGTSLSARAAYDREYLYNKTLRDAGIEATLGGLGLNYSLSISAPLAGYLNASELLACATLQPAGPCPYGSSARDLVVQTQDRLETQYHNAKRTYDATAARADEYIQSASEKLQVVPTLRIRVRVSSHGRIPWPLPLVSRASSRLN